MIIFRNLTATLRTAAAAVLLSLAIPLFAQEYTPLITSIDQIKGISNLKDQNIDPTDIDAQQPQYNLDQKFTVEFEDGIQLSPTRGLIMYLGRYQRDGAPTLVQIESSTDGGTTYTTLGYAHFLYRGGGNTHEFSDIIYPKQELTINRLRVSVLKTATGIDHYRLFKLNFFACNKGDLYPGGRLDPLRLPSDYYKSFMHYSYESNDGILNVRNHYGDNKDYPTETPWGDDNTFVYEGEVHELPTFHKQGGGQMPHVTEYTLYAMPGDMISLSPYYDLPTQGNYRDKYSHWYGYIPRNSKDVLQEQDYHHITDSRGNRLLDFLIDPSAIVLTEKAGYFGGTSFPRPIGTYVIRSFEDLQAFSNLVAQGGGYQSLNAILADDIDCEGQILNPIGGWSSSLNDNVKYNGIFNGNGHTISNFNIKKNSGDYHVGFFGWLGDAAKISDLSLVDFQVRAGGRAGGLVGVVDGGVTIDNCYIKGDIDIIAGANVNDTNISYAGGVVGIAVSGANISMNNVVFTGTVAGGYGTNGSNGALVGYFETGSTGTVSKCYADATVSNIKGENGMFSNFNPISVADSYTNVRSADFAAGTGLNYLVHQAGFANVYGQDNDAFHTVPEAYEQEPGTHFVRVFGIPDDPALWPVVYINCWREGFDTKWPGIKLTKGNGYYYTTIADLGIVTGLMVNNGNDGGSHDYVMGNQPCFSANDNRVISVDFSETGGDYNITFNGNLEQLGLSPLAGAANATRIFVKDETDKWDNYMLSLSNSTGATYKAVTVNGYEFRDGQRYAVFDLPADFSRSGLKYTIIPYKGFLENTPLARAVANPMPAQAAGTHRIYVKRFNAAGWDECRAYVWAEGGNPTEWPGKTPDGTVTFDGQEYYYYDLASCLGSYGGITFNNGKSGAANGELQFQDAIVYYNGNMKVELNQVSTNTGNSEGQISGGYFNPIFFEYTGAAPRITVGVTEYTAGTAVVNGTTYYYINLAPVYGPAGHLVSSSDKVGDRPNSTVINKNDVVDVADLWSSYGADYPAQFCSALPLDGNPTVYLDSRDVSSLVRQNLGWADRYGVPAPSQSSVEIKYDSQIEDAKFQSHNDLRWYGAEATFYQPYNVDYAPTDPENLNLEKPEYHIAADFAHEFNAEKNNEYNMDWGNGVEGTIHEPVISFRHIFHIKDGKTFADANTTSKEKNDEYLVANSRAVSARAGHDFQIRVSQQIPYYQNNNEELYVLTNFYYKNGENSYTRVPRAGIEVLNADGTLAADQGMFFFDANTTTQGTRKYPDGNNGFAIRDVAANGAAYHGGNGGSSVVRSIYCRADNAKEGTYIIRLKALNPDGSEIKIYGTNDNLYIDEYVVTFLDDQSASVLTEEQLADEAYYTHRVEYLEQEEVCGPAAVVVDFDQYRVFEERENKDAYFRHHGNGTADQVSYRWPMLWQKSSYSFGYGGYYSYDFNEYIIANHSNEVMYHAAADNNGGLYDRLYYDTSAADPSNAQKGYFFYVNAASDPGVVARLTINSLCPGSTVAVSAWVAEMSYENEVANLSFNFVAVDLDGNREIVHSFVTGYIDNLNYPNQAARAGQAGKTPTSPAMADHGKWMHIYYSFIPDLTSVKNLTAIDHYELELENNCVSSIGADYAVDDIRAYIISPQITATQLEPVCDANQKTVGIRLRSRFDKLLSSNGLEQTTEDQKQEITLNFAVLDKKKYDQAYAEFAGMSFETGDERTAYLAKIVRNSAIIMHETENPDVDATYYVPMAISTYYEGMPEYDESTLNTAMRYTSTNAAKTRYFQSNLKPFDSDLRPGKDYYVVLYAQYDNLPTPEEAGLSVFAITDDPCAKYAVMTLQGSGVIKIDGIAYNDGNPIEVCEGQSPVVQVDLKMLAGGQEIETPNSYDDYVNAPNHYYDWFLGPIDEFMAGESGKTPYDLLYMFRNGQAPSGEATPSGNGNINATELPDPVAGETDVYAPLRKYIEEGRLVLHASSFVFPPIQGSADDEERILVLTAMPIIPGPDDDEKNYKVCSQPNEIRLRVADSAPRMLDGFDGIEYPEEDVPLRLGFRQLNSINGVAPLTSNGGDNLVVNKTVAIPADAKYLELPLRGITSYKGEGSDATMGIGGNVNEEGDPFVYLVETNDPRYIGLDKHPMDKQAIKNGLLPIGMMQNMTAIKNGTANSVGIVFSKQMEFREGYYYRVRFNFDEVLNTEVDGYCQGQVVFTLKVVPEYMKWTGVDSRNWNNDANWSRVKAEELLLPDGDAKTSDHTIVNDKKRIALVENAMGVIETREVDVTGNAMSYAPLDFTKVIVPNLRGDETAKGYPWMFTASSKDIQTLNGSRTWNDKATSAVVDAEGIATENIEFDMTSLDLTGKLACRPWYANTCDQIHFNHGAELVHQESFVFEKNYQKAWVDMEMTGDRWYTLGSPLQGVVAGDMYTKTAGGKQDNELFTEINFNNTDYGRFEPAVYQRGWNKAETKTYFLGDESHASKSTAVSLNWSRVYNDVDEDYAPGTGFSIRTESKGIDNWGEDKIVRFRLPKADDTYKYFDPGNNTEGADDTNVTRNGNRHSLIAFNNDGKFEPTVSVGTAGNYFLVGNPFIARMDMAKFLVVNSNVIDPYYWIMTSNRQDATYWDEKSGTFISTDLTEKADGQIAPMQGFFVKAKNAATKLTLTFTPDMIVTGKIDNDLELKNVSIYEPQLITVSALDADGEVASRAIINIDPMAQGAYDGAEDAALLLDRTLDSRATVYTVASEQALAINSLDAIVETEVGLLAAADDVVSTLVFEGVDNAEGLLLLDTTTGQFTDLYDGMTVEVEGSASGRFYITRPTSGLTELTMAVVLKDRTVSIVAATEGIVARVYTPAGLSLGEWSVDDTSLQFDLEPGIFIVEAVADNQRVTRKFVVK